MNEILYPPIPPLNLDENNTFVPGTFVYIEDDEERYMLFTAYQALTYTETWDYIKHMNDTTFNETLQQIIDKIEELGCHGHSGSSFYRILGKMKYISMYGEKQFREMYDRYRK
jgi:hypothetical protein